MNEQFKDFMEFLMKIAEEDIDYEHCEENLEQIYENLKHDYDIVIDENTKITMNLISNVIECINQWQLDTKNNY